MLARRLLRIRVLQTLYAFYQNETGNVAVAEKDLFNGTNRLYDLYLTLLQLFIELAHQEKIYMTDVAGKFIVSKKKYFRTLDTHPFVLSSVGARFAPTYADGTRAGGGPTAQDHPREIMAYCMRQFVSNHSRLFIGSPFSPIRMQ